MMTGAWLRRPVGPKDGERNRGAEDKHCRYVFACIHGAFNRPMRVAPLNKKATTRVDHVPGGFVPALASLSNPV